MEPASNPQRPFRPTAVTSGAEADTQGALEHRIEHLEDLQRWQADNAKRLQEWCASMSEFCAEQHREVETLRKLLRATATTLGLVDQVEAVADPPPAPDFEANAR